jgi:hypothetical protein
MLMVGQLRIFCSSSFLHSAGLVTGQIGDEIKAIGRSIEQLYGVLNEDSLKLQ